MNIARITHVTSGFGPMKKHVLDVLNSGTSAGHFVVLDIDDTLITDPHGGGVDVVEEGMWVLRAALARNLDVFIVTARPDTPSNTNYTKRELEQVGIFVRDGQLYMRPPRVRTALGISAYKFGCRDDIEQTTGKKCLLTVGDQWSDLSIVNDDEYIMLRSSERGAFILTRLHKHGYGLKFNRPNNT